MKNTNELPFGYKENGEIDLLQADVVRAIFEIMIKYSDKITDEQLEDFVEEHKEQYGEDLDYTQAKETLAIGMAKRFINEELDRKWQEYLSAKKEAKVSGSGE